MVTEAARSSRGLAWLSALVPVGLIVVLVGLFLAFDPIGSLRTVPPVEAIAFERVTLTPDNIEMRLRNDGPDPVTVSQVLVNDAYWDFSITDDELGRLETARLDVPYPWEEGLPVNIALVTSTGATIEHDIEAAALTPELNAATLWTYALLGLYIGVVPVAIGLLWFPSLRRASREWLRFFLAFTVGLLLFLLVDTTAEGIELAGESAQALDALSLFAIGAVGAVVGLLVLQGSLERKGEGGRGGVAKLGERSPQIEAGSKRATMLSHLALAYLIAAGIGLHNLGEGLAVGAALAAGEAALGTFLVVGFAIHNTTEGLAIVAPLGEGRSRPSLLHFAAFGLVAGAPAILGAWLGGFAFNAAWAALAFGVAAGAIAQVVWQIGRSMDRGRALTTAYGAAGLLAGLVFMYVTGLMTA